MVLLRKISSFIDDLNGFANHSFPPLTGFVFKTLVGAEGQAWRCYLFGYLSKIINSPAKLICSLDLMIGFDKVRDGSI